MTYRHFLGTGALFISVTITGCAKQPKHTRPTAEEQPPVERYSQLADRDAAAQGHTDLNVASDKTEEILAQKTASYAEELERLLAARAAEKAAAATQQQQQPAQQQPQPQAAPTTKPAGAKSEVTWVDDPRQLPPVTPQSPQAPAAVAKAAAAADAMNPTIHQLLETAPATANQAIKIPTGNEQVAVQPAPVVDVKPVPQPAQLKAQAAQPAAVAGDALGQKLGERMKADPLDVAAHVDFQLLQMLGDQSVPDLNAIATLPQEDREIVAALMDGLSNFRSGIRAGGNALLAQKVGPLVEMGDRLRNQTTLAMPKVVLCRDVKQFGVYQPFESTRFPFGEKHPVVVYCEVANFASQLNSKSLWETKLKYEVLLYTDSDAALQVWQQKPTPVVDLCHSRRRDFFIAKLMELPQDLPIGGYLMKVSLVDETANRIAEATVPLQIVAK
jgi:hypothetical protein